MVLLGGRTLSATLIVAPVLAFLLWLSGAVAPAATLALLVPFTFVVLLAGRLLLRAAGAADAPLAAGWALGAFATSLAVYALGAVLAWTAAAAFAAWAAAVFACAFLRPASQPPPRDAADLAGLAVCAAATLVWSWDVAIAPQRLMAGEPFFAWIDYLIHGGVISQLGDPRAVGGSIDLARVAAVPYHYASYAMAAALAAPLDLPGLPLATSAWQPLGVLTLCAGAYALGAVLAGPTGGLAAVAALVLLPDPASYGLHNGLFGFRWNAIAGSPGAAYAVGFCLLALALLGRWANGGGQRLLWAACVVAAGTALFRVHIFALAFPATLAAAALALPAVRRRWLLFAAGALAALAAFVLAFYALVPYAVPALEVALDMLHADYFSAPNAYMGWYAAFEEAHGAALAVPAGIGLTFAASLGALIVLCPLAAWIARRRLGLRPTDPVPGAFVAASVALLVTAPVSEHGDPTELTQRPLVVLYAVLAAWTAATLVAALAPRGEAGARRSQRALLAASVLGLAMIWPWTRQMGGEPGFSWGWHEYTARLEDGLPQAARFLRAHASPGDVFAVREVDLRGEAVDPATRLLALSGVPAYIARPNMQVFRGGERERIARGRYADLARVASEASADAALKRLRELGIRWYVVLGEGPAWDPGVRGAAFVSGRVAVYASR